MAMMIRYIAWTGCLVVATMLAACGTGGASPSTPPPTSAGGASQGAGTPSGRGSAGVGGATPTPSGTGEFVLTEGVEHDVCGIGLVVKFIPPSARATTADQAFLVGGPISDVHAVLPEPTGDTPLPSNIAPARADQTVTVLGRRFTVVAVDIANKRVRLVALC